MVNSCAGELRAERLTSPDSGENPCQGPHLPLCRWNTHAAATLDTLKQADLNVVRSNGPNDHLTDNCQGGRGIFFPKGSFFLVLGFLQTLFLEVEIRSKLIS